MRYDRELQNAGKFFVATTQRDGGVDARKAMQMLKSKPGTALNLRIECRDGKLIAFAGTAYKSGGTWGMSDEEELLLE